MAEPSPQPDPALTARAMFIVFEGPDGVGKTTQRDRLAARLRALGRDVVCLAEPSKGPWGMKIREAARTNTRPADPREEVRWFIEDRREDCATNIEPALAAGRDVLLDRYFYSTAAYQGARGVPVDEILAANRTFAREPDLVLVFKLDEAIAQRRIAESRGEAPDAFEAIEYQRRVAGIFEQLMESERDRALMTAIDASAAPDAVEARVWDAVRKRFATPR